MDERVARILRPIRTGLQILAEPIDWASRMLNEKKGYPPLWIRQKVGSLNDFEGSAGEYMAYLKLLCNLKPGHNVLDIGCGCGLVCLKVNENGTLLDYTFPGIYIGMDTDRQLINWCSRNIKKEAFETLTGDEKKLPLFGIHFDTIICKSLFTHLLMDEAQKYLEEIKRLLTPEGKCLSTWFILPEWPLTGRYTFRYKNSGIAYERETKPRLAVAYNERTLESLIRESGLDYIIHYGTWSGRQDGLSFQDILILGRRS